MHVTCNCLATDSCVSYIHYRVYITLIRMFCALHVQTTEHMLKAVVTALQNVYQNDRGALPLQEQNTLVSNCRSNVSEFT